VVLLEVVVVLLLRSLRLQLLQLPVLHTPATTPVGAHAAC
jgi:hypothetical protein